MVENQTVHLQRHLHVLCTSKVPLISPLSTRGRVEVDKSAHTKSSPPIIMHHANPFLAAVNSAVSIEMSGNKKDWPKRDPTCTLIHSHCHSVDLAILFFISTHYVEVCSWIPLWKLFIWRSPFLHHTAAELQCPSNYGRRRVYTTVCLHKSHLQIFLPFSVNIKEFVQQRGHLTDWSISKSAAQGAFDIVDQKHQPNHH